MLGIALRHSSLSQPKHSLLIRATARTIDLQRLITRTMSESTGGTSGGTTSRGNRNTGGRGRGPGGKRGATNGGRGTSHRYVPPQQRRSNEQTKEAETKNNSDTSRAGSSRKGAPKKNQNRGPQRGRTNDNKNCTRNRNTENRGGAKLKVFDTATTDNDDPIGNKNFQQMHRECKALRYKVHKPNCNCPKLLRMIQGNDFVNELAETATIEDGKFDALVVVPDTKQRYIYVCRDTLSDAFQENPRKAEFKLRDEIFSNTTATEAPVEEGETAAAATIVDESQFKLSCASCLLIENEPNGFCLIASSAPDVVDLVRDESRSKSREKEAVGQPLHPDHAHFVARLPRTSLWKLHRSKTRSQTSQAVDEILCHLSGQDISAVSDVERFSNGIEIGHHLLSVLTLTDKSDDSWLVIGYDDHKSLMLDLPGGKRHLGETSVEGAIRETEEESSLVWDPSWVVDVLECQKASNRHNRYFLLHPPQSFLENLKTYDK